MEKRKLKQWNASLNDEMQAKMVKRELKRVIGNYGMNFRPNPKRDRTHINFRKFLKWKMETLVFSYQKIRTIFDDSWLALVFCVYPTRRHNSLHPAGHRFVELRWYHFSIFLFNLRSAKLLQMHLKPKLIKLEC